MLGAFSRTELLIGKRGMERLRSARIAVIGVGGVGSWAAEALARAGVGGLRLVDDDSVCLTNINRQAQALRSTVGKPKVEALRDRLLDIHPDLEVEAIAEFATADNLERLLSPPLDYALDAIDTISSKIALILKARELGLPLISSMGAGAKLDPSRFEIADIYSTSICPLAAVLRKELRRRGVPGLKVVYSREAVLPSGGQGNPCAGQCICPKKDRTCLERRGIRGTFSFTTAAAGLLAASEMVRDILGPFTPDPEGESGSDWLV